VNEWLPRLPLALLACARALLIPGAAASCCTRELSWPALGLLARLRGASGPVPAALRAPGR
jgi:hypothetical protein